ncbi:MAG TPA: hypothetical protein VGB79_12790 [Allosphingosinicella sp.]|jgi:hypothetical protein
MDRNEAAAALADVGRTEQRLAQRARWPFHRHAMFGLSEGLLVAAVAQPLGIAAPMTAAAMALLVVCIADDRRRHGMFVSGWQPGATRPLTIMLFAFLLAMVAGAALVRDGDAAQPIGYLLGAVAFLVCTAASLRWEKIYRAELEGEGRP